MGVYTKLTDDEKEYLERIYSKKFKKIIAIKKGILNSNFLIYTDNSVSTAIKFSKSLEKCENPCFSHFAFKENFVQTKSNYIYSNEEDKHVKGFTSQSGLSTACDEEKYILRIFEANRSLEEEEQEIEFLNLISEFVPVSLAIKNIENKYISTYKEKKYSLFRYVEGNNILKPNRLNIHEIGIYLGKIHKFSKNLKQEKFNRKTRIDFNFYFNKFKNNFKKLNFFLDEDEKQKLLKQGEEIEKIDFSGLPSGVIHGDIFPDNILVNKENITAILDFNEINYSPFIFDIAAVINFWIKFYRYSKIEENDRIRDFFNNYSRYRKIEKEELKLLALACKKVALTFIFLRIYKESIDSTYLKAVDIEKKSYKELMFLLD